MMDPVDRIAREFGVSIADLTIWIERRWLLPGSSGGEMLFTDADRARLRMIVEFRRDLAIDDETLPIVLDLLDRLHAARSHLRAVLEAVAELPDAEQTTILRRIGR